MKDQEVDLKVATVVDSEVVTKVVMQHLKVDTAAITAVEQVSAQGAQILAVTEVVQVAKQADMEVTINSIIYKTILSL